MQNYSNCRNCRKSAHVDALHREIMIWCRRYPPQTNDCNFIHHRDNSGRILCLDQWRIPSCYCSGLIRICSVYGIARWRADQVNLQLPDIMGIESPVAITMAGLTLIQIAGRLGDANVTQNTSGKFLFCLEP